MNGKRTIYVRHAAGHRIGRHLVPIRSQAQVAALLGVTASAISAIENLAFWKIEKRMLEIVGHNK